MVYQERSRPIAQLAEHRSPKPGVGGSNPSWPVIVKRGWIYEKR